MCINASYDTHVPKDGVLSCIHMIMAFTDTRTCRAQLQASLHLAAASAEVCKVAALAVAQLQSDSECAAFGNYLLG